MKKIELSYDAYRKEAICADGSMKDFFFSRNGQKTLDEWCDDFLEEIINNEHCDVCIELSALERDCDTMEDAIKAYNAKNSNGFKIEFKRNETKSITDGQDVNAKMAKLTEIYNKLKSPECPFDDVRNSSEIEENFQKAQNREFEIAVVATMSSGKSTLINAMLGRELLPARNEATTATIAKILNSKVDNFSAESYDKQMNIIDKKEPLTLHDMETLNANKNTAFIYIKGKIDGISNEGLNLILIDTPGPNNSRTEEHKLHTYKLLQANYKPMILYILNVTNFEPTDDKSLLRDISDAMSKGGRQSSDRFIFVLNKADELDPEKNEPLERKLEDAKRYLEREFGIKDPKIFPCASRLAKLIRQDLNGETLSPREKSSLRADVALFVEEPHYHFSDFAPLSDSARAKINEQLKAAKERNSEREEALIYTGIPAVEVAISEYLEKYALPAKITEILHSFSQTIDSVEKETKLNSSLENNQIKVKKTIEAIEHIIAQLENGDKAKELIAKIDDLSIEADLKNALEVLIGKKKQELINKIIYKYKGKVLEDEANRKINLLKEEIEDFGNKFAIDIEMLLNTKIGDEAGKYVDEYNRYVVDLIEDAFEYNINPASVLGSLANFTFEANVDKYKIEVEEEVGSHIETRTRTVFVEQIRTKTTEQSGFWGSIKRRIDFFDNGWGYDESWETYKEPIQEEYDVEIIDKEKRKYINLGELAKNKALFFFGDISKAAMSLAIEYTANEEKNLKEKFKRAFNDINAAIDYKSKYKKEQLENQKDLEKLIEDSKAKLAWLKDFDAELKKALA